MQTAVQTALLEVPDVSDVLDVPPVIRPKVPVLHTTPNPIVSGRFDALTLGLPHKIWKETCLLHGDSFAWLAALPENTLHAIVTDPPYGVKEYETDQIEKRDNGVGGIWRLPPAFDGNTRAPMPRFTALNAKERQAVATYFVDWSRLVLRALRPGGHVFLASNTFLSQLVFASVTEGGLEFRGELIRLVRTLRGGDRPKGAEAEFAGVCSLPRGSYEPWGIFRKPLPAGMTVSECLRQWQTGGLRRTMDDKPFGDVIVSERTPRRERDIAHHPSIKPQSLMRQIVHAALPLGEGIIADPFAGSGSTLAAAAAIGYAAVGVERHDDYYHMAVNAVPQLSTLQVEPFKAGVLSLLDE